MGGWMDGWMDGLMDGRMDGWAGGLFCVRQRKPISMCVLHVVFFGFFAAFFSAAVGARFF